MAEYATPLGPITVDAELATVDELLEHVPDPAPVLDSILAAMIAVARARHVYPETLDALNLNRLTREGGASLWIRGEWHSRHGGAHLPLGPRTSATLRARLRAALEAAERTHQN